MTTLNAPFKYVNMVIKYTSELWLFVELFATVGQEIKAQVELTDNPLIAKLNYTFAPSFDNSYRVRLMHPKKNEKGKIVMVVEDENEALFFIGDASYEKFCSSIYDIKAECIWHENVTLELHVIAADQVASVDPVVPAYSLFSRLEHEFGDCEEVLPFVSESAQDLISDLL